ncbi:MAG: YkgJ family cysteine cluster protein [Pseudomonadota bacterium]
MLQELEFQVLEVYQELDVAVAAFAGHTGLACPQGCGHCCSSENVEATVLECIPVAFELFRTFQAELILKRLEKNGDEKRCVLYRSDYTEVGLWGCSQYRTRTVVCRLFGFAGNRDRTGIPRLAMCRVMKERLRPETITVALKHDDLVMPLFSEAGLRITALHPGLGTLRMPVNTALREALQKVGMILDLAAPDRVVLLSDPEHPPDKPIFPLTPIKKRAA